MGNCTTFCKDNTTFVIFNPKPPLERSERALSVPSKHRDELIRAGALIKNNAGYVLSVTPLGLVL